jgi:amidase/aspartyl-tRNA(Asn)/glutamyl-tRNA(Gln) amidotransferase subunit A
MRPLTDTDCFLSACHLATEIREGKVDPADVIEVLEKQITKHDPKLNAFIYLDLVNAKADARMKAKLLAQHPKMPVGPLYGVPVAVKDDLYAIGFPTTMGSRVMPSDKVKEEDLIVARLKAAGAIVIGKTHEPEFGHKGVTNNLMGPNGAPLQTATPWDTNKTSGGSSGGSAAAVAAGLAYLALGTDIAGSVRIPASCCGVVALKPTFGLVPRVPAGNAFTLWVAGPLARTVGDVALAMSVLAGPDPRDRFSYPALPGDTWDVTKKPVKPRILWCPSPAGTPVDHEVEDLCLTAVRGLREATGGHLTEQKELMPRKEAKELLEYLTTVFAAGSLGELRYYSPHKDRKGFAAAMGRLSPSYAAFVAPAWGITLDEYQHAEAGITKFCETRGAALFAGHDLVAMPTLAVPPFDKKIDLGPNAINGVAIDPHLEWLFTWPFNLTGDPAVSVPCGLTKAGLPVGLQLAAPRGQDGLVLRAAAVVEDAVKWEGKRPTFKAG